MVREPVRRRHEQHPWAASASTAAVIPPASHRMPCGQAVGLTRSTLYRHLPARPPEPLTAVPPAIDEVSRRPPATPASPLTCPSCGHRPASRAEIPGHRADTAILWLHLDGSGRIVEAHHCAICQPREHVVSVACADCGDGLLITGQLLGLGDHPAVPALDWLATRARLANLP